MNIEIFFQKKYFFEKIKLSTVDSATFYTNPTKNSLQKNVRKTCFFRHFFLNRSGSRDHAVTKPIKSIRSIATTCLLFKTSKIIKIGSRSSENGGVKTHRCSGGGGPPNCSPEPYVKYEVNFKSGLTCESPHEAR